MATKILLFIYIYKLFLFYSKLSVHVLMSELDAPELKRCPSNQFPPFASLSNNSPLCPNPLDAEVQNGITVFPRKLFSLTKVSTGHAAIPHQIG